MSATDACAVPGCDKFVGQKGAKGFCTGHYHRLTRHGDPIAGGAPRTPRPPTCTVGDCGKQPTGRGMCGAHYYLWRKHGDPLVKWTSWDGRHRVNIWTRVAKTDSHWHWLGYKDKKGYGWLSGKPAHRIIWELVNGPIAVGLQIDHVCRTHDCVRPHPDHLEPVTQQENIARGDGLSVLNSTKTHCPREHPYDQLNTYVDPTGGRRCRRCARERSQALRSCVGGDW